MKRKEIKKNRKIPHKSRLIEFREIEETACVPATPEVYVAKRSRGGNQVRRETNRTLGSTSIPVRPRKYYSRCPVVRGLPKR